MWVIREEADKGNKAKENKEGKMRSHIAEDLKQIAEQRAEE